MQAASGNLHRFSQTALVMWRKFLSGVLRIPWLMCEVSKPLGMLLTMLFGLYILIFAHDLSVHLNGGRPWIPFHEFAFGLLFSVEGNGGTLSSVPLNGNVLSLNVLHVHRGKHALSIWIPEKKKDLTPVGANIHFSCEFMDARGDVLFSAESDTVHGKYWSWCRGKRGGSDEVYCIYSVPKDVPLDRDLTVRMKIDGELGKFHGLYPNAKLSIIKYPDK